MIKNSRYVKNKTYTYLQAFKLNTVGIKTKYTTRKVWNTVGPPRLIWCPPTTCLAAAASHPPVISVQSLQWFPLPIFKKSFSSLFLFVIYIKIQFVTQIVIWHRLALTLLNAELLQILLCLFVYKSTYYRCFVSTTLDFMLDPHIYILQPPCFYIF